MLTTTEKTSVRHACAWNRANPVLTGVPMAGANVLCLLLLVGCTSHVRTEKAVTLEQPRVKNGVIVEEDDHAKLEELAAGLDALDLPSADSDPAVESNKPQESDPNRAVKADQADASPPRVSVAESAKPRQSDPNQAATVKQVDASPPKVSVAQAVDMTARQAVAPNSTKLIALPKLNRTELNEIVEHLVLGMESGLGYVATSAAVADALPIPPTGTFGDRILARPGETGTHVLRLGYRFFASQPPQLWAQGVIVSENGTLTANPDLAQIEPNVKQVVASLNEMRAGLTVRDLEAKLIQLSYVDSATAMSVLKGFGITTLDQAAAVPPKIEFANLPYVVNIKDPEAKYTGLVGVKTKAEAGGTFRLSMAPGAASELEDNTIASPLTQLLVLFHPAHPEQYSEVRRLLDAFIDRPARQIFIEAMVLEISEQGLKELGVEWELNESPLFITAGSQNAGVSTDTLNIRTPDTSLLNEIFEGSEFEWDWEATIRALVRSGKAEILSRPSVLTLDNRQSTIRVGEDIPIASSVEGGYGGGKVGFKFEYLPTGILLNIRPRISESGAEVSMLVDTIVSARVPNKDLEIREPGTAIILASAPTVSTRRVQTYGRLPNNTPLIIGGLVAREDTVTQDKVPFLGDLPVIGFAFRSEKKERLKREVIIVLTPHVLPEQREVLRALPKDEDTFDNFGHTLFRDSYRIRAEDVFDLTFLLENRRIATYRSLAREAAQKNFRLGITEPFRSFVRDNVPGESILVTRMIYEVIKRLDIARQIETSRIIYFEGQEVGGYGVKFLDAILEGREETGVTNFGDRALALTYQYDRAAREEGRLGNEPIPEIRLIDCPDRETWARLLWELNQPGPNGRQRHTILIQDESDIFRLRRALTLKRVAVLNGGTEEMRLRNFSIGKVLLMPELKQGQIHVIDADTAMYFFHTELYYAATLAEIEKQLKELDTELRRPDIRVLLDSALPGDNPAEGAK